MWLGIMSCVEILSTFLLVFISLKFRSFLLVVVLGIGFKYDVQLSFCHVHFGLIASSIS